MAIRFPPAARVTNTPYRDLCEREATRAAIFLLQKRQISLRSTAIPGVKPEDDECLWFCVKDQNILPQWCRKFIVNCFADGPKIRVDGAFLSDAVGKFDADGQFITREQWHTESVWLDRDEAEQWAESHAYLFAHGWRVYSVCAEGELAKMLKRQDGK